VTVENVRDVFLDTVYNKNYHALICN